MFDKPEDITPEGILVAHQRHPTFGAVKLARVLVPGVSDADVTRIASQVGRVWRKHGLKRAPATRAPAPTTEQAEPVAEPPGGRKGQLAQDIAQLRTAIGQMLERGVYTAVPGTMKLVQELEKELAAILKAESETAMSDIGTGHVVEELRKLPRWVLEQALSTD